MWGPNELFPPMLDAVMAFAAERHEVGILIRPAVPDGNYMMHVKLDALGVQFFTHPTAMHAAKTIAGLDPAATFSANARGMVGAAAFVIGVLGPHGPGDLGAALVESSPSALDRPGSDFDRLSAQVTGALNQYLFHTGIDAHLVHSE